MVGLPRGTVELEAYNLKWRDHYEAEVRRLRSVAGDRLLEFQHIGSTAVEDVPAKPIVDLLAVVEDSSVADDLVPLLEANGYERRPDDVSDRVFLARGPPPNRTHYLSLVERDSDCYAEQVAFRDYLREQPTVADEYAELKRTLADEHPDDRATYTAKKSEFVERVLDDALDS